MNENKIIKLKSLTYATKARNLLLKYSIYSEIIKSPKTAGKSTCGYSLIVPKNGDKAAQILSSKGFVLLSVEEAESLDIS